MARKRGEQQEAEGPETTEYFLARLAEETKRSERYNHFFSVVVLSCAAAKPHEIFNRVRPCLRCTDIVQVIGLPDREKAVPPKERAAPAGRPHLECVAAILPETDREGASAAVSRCMGDLVNMKGVKFGLAVYPADSTNAHSLLDLASAA